MLLFLLGWGWTVSAGIISSWRNEAVVYMHDLQVQMHHYQTQWRLVSEAFFVRSQTCLKCFCSIIVTLTRQCGPRQSSRCFGGTGLPINDTQPSELMDTVSPRLQRLQKRHITGDRTRFRSQPRQSELAIRVRLKCPLCLSETCCSSPR